jgi:hypothetical protein
VDEKRRERREKEGMFFFLPCSMITQKSDEESELEFGSNDRTQCLLKGFESELIFRCNSQKPKL